MCKFFSIFFTERNKFRDYKRAGGHCVEYAAPRKRRSKVQQKREPHVCEVLLGPPK